MASSTISSREVGYRSFWSNPASIGLWEGKSRDGVDCLSTDPLNFKADVSRDSWVTVPPSTTLPSSLGGSAPVQYRINPGTCGQIMEVYLDLTVANTDPVNSVTPIAYPFFVSRIECGLNANPSPIQILYPEFLYSAYSQYSNEDMTKACFANQLNMAAGTWGSESALAPSSSVTYSMPLHGYFAAHGEINAMAISGALMLSWYQNATPVVSGTGTLTQTFTQLRIRSRIDPAYDLARLKLLKKLPQLITYLKTPIQTYYNTIASGQNTVTLTGVSDFTMGLKIFIRAAASYQTMTPVTVGGVLAPGIRNFQAIGGTAEATGGGTAGAYVDVLSASGVSIYGVSNIITPVYLRSQDMISPKSFGQMLTVVPIYELGFPQGADYPRALERAVQGG